MENNPKITTTSVKSSLIEVRDTAVAAALRAIDIPFYDPERPSSMLAYADGRRVTTWRLKAKSLDGKHDTYKLATAVAADPYSWIEKNPEHPFAYALSAALRAAYMTEYNSERRAMVGYHVKGNRTVFVFENSRRHEKLKRLKAQQI